MRMHRLYQPGPYQTGDEITLDKTGSQHLIKVLRYKGGDSLIIFDGHGNSFNATVASISPKSTTVKLGQHSDEHTESSLLIHIGLAVSKGERMDFAIQKAVEAGVFEITPIITRHSVVRLDDKRKESRLWHWQGITRHACEQSGRSVIPQINPVIDFPSALTNFTADTKLILDPDTGNSLHSIKTKPTSVAILIGPEGGFSESEISDAMTNGFSVIKLGPRVFRAETAPVAACIALQTLWGDLA